jgi:uncharacterized protein (TIGR01777 family)
MKIVIAGGNGFLGKALCTYFLKDPENEIFVLSRKPHLNYSRVKYLLWDGKSFGYWVEFLEKSDVLINLSGQSVNCRYNPKNKLLLHKSRLESTYILCQAISNLVSPPKVMIQMSSATIYEDSYKEFNTEESSRIGSDFSMDLCKKWEDVLINFPLYDTKKIIIRSALVFGKEGILPEFEKLVKFGFGKRFGSGKQMVSWISEEDFCRGIRFLINQPEGVYNLAAPKALTLKDFLAILSNKLNVSIRIPVPKWLVVFGAILKGTEAELILKSRWVFPEKLLKNGFVFHHTSFGSLVNNP